MIAITLAARNSFAEAVMELLEETKKVSDYKPLTWYFMVRGTRIELATPTVSR